jgi:hypothetical protein
VVVIPYVAGLSEAIRRAGTSIGKIFSLPVIKKRFTHFKPKQNRLEKEVIYKIPCECGANYIGETGLPLKTRVNELKWNWLKSSKLQEKDINEENISSLLAAHATENKHHVKCKWEEVKILGKENHYKNRKSMKQWLYMHIESNVISQHMRYPHSGTLYEEKKGGRLLERENLEEKRRNREIIKRQGKEVKEEASSVRWEKAEKNGMLCYINIGEN